jgi:hypothetical protein
MSLIKFKAHVVLDDGTEKTVVCDQRDLAAAEGADVSRMEARHTWVRFCAWNALRRTKAYGGTWQEFNEVDCVQAQDVPMDAEEPSGDEDGLDPGLKVPTAGT